MGFALGLLPFFDACHAVCGIRDPFLSLGSAEIWIAGKPVAGFGALLREHYAIEEYADIDLNRASSLHGDLSKPLPENLVGQWRTLYDGGTLEHIFDISAAFVNIHRLCAEGGLIIHISPVSWLNHGYYNLSPRLFHALANSNNYQVEAQAWYFHTETCSGTDAGSFLKRLFGQNSSQQQGLCLMEGNTPQAAYDWLVDHGFATPPANTLYCIAYRKLGKEEFVIPTDIC